MKRSRAESKANPGLPSGGLRPQRPAAPGIVKLGLLQARCSTDPAENLSKTLDLASAAADHGAQIICTQELFRSQYFCQTKIMPISAWRSHPRSQHGGVSKDSPASVES